MRCPVAVGVGFQPGSPTFLSIAKVTEFELADRAAQASRRVRRRDQAAQSLSPPSAQRKASAITPTP
jgi:hypothetical protein